MPLPAGKTEIKDGTLTIRNLRPVDGGLYQCIATNSMGTKHFTMNVNVQRRGMLTIGLEKLFLLLARSQVALHSTSSKWDGFAGTGPDCPS